LRPIILRHRAFHFSSKFHSIPGKCYSITPPLSLITVTCIYIRTVCFAPEGLYLFVRRQIVTSRHACLNHHRLDSVYLSFSPTKCHITCEDVCVLCLTAYFVDQLQPQRGKIFT
jgi:hypothetical protein